MKNGTNELETALYYGANGKDITTPPRELRWKSDQWSFKNSPYTEVPRLLADQCKRFFEKEVFIFFI